MLLGMAACTGDFADINRNPNEVTDEQLQANNYKIGTNLKTLQGLVVPTQEHMYQFLESLVGGPYAGYIGATVDTWQNKFETFNASGRLAEVALRERHQRDLPGLPRHHQRYGRRDGPRAGRCLPHCNHAARDGFLRSDSPTRRSWPTRPNHSRWPYDTQQEAYAAMFEELDAAIASLEDNLTLPSDAFGRYDGVYAGNIAQWLKFANSLKLRMAMRLTYVDEETARTKAAEAIAGGVITTNADNARMQTSDNRMTLIYNDWGDHRVGADIISYMNGYNDPRREKMFTTVRLVENGQGGAGLRRHPYRHQRVEQGHGGFRLFEHAHHGDGSLPVDECRGGDLPACGSTNCAGARQKTPGRSTRMPSDCRSRSGGASGADAYIADATHTPAAYVDPIGRYSVSTPQSSVTIAWDDKATDIETNLEKDYHPEVDCHLPAGDRGVGRTPAHGLSEVASGG